MSEYVPFRLNKYLSRNIFKVILLSLYYINREDVEYNYGLFRMSQMEEACTMNITDEFNP